MNVRCEIERDSAPQDVAILLWLLETYKYASKWAFVADCRFERYGVETWKSRRIWSPTAEGRLIYLHRAKLSTLDREY